MDNFALLSFGADGWGDELLDGLKVTLALAFVTAPLALATGFMLALARRSARWTLRVPATAFCVVFKGLPELITLFIVYYGSGLLVRWVAGFFTDVYFDMPAFASGVIALGAVSASYVAEVFMGALSGVPKGQREAAQALGLGPRATMWKIMLPQVMRLALPGLSNLWLVLLKDTALVMALGLPDLLRRTFVAVGVTKEPFFFFAVAILIYFAISLVSSGLLSLLEARYNRAYAR